MSPSVVLLSFAVMQLMTLPGVVRPVTMQVDVPGSTIPLQRCSSEEEACIFVSALSIAAPAVYAFVEMWGTRNSRTLRPVALATLSAVAIVLVSTLASCERSDASMGLHVVSFSETLFKSYTAFGSEGNVAMLAAHLAGAMRWLVVGPRCVCVHTRTRAVT